MKNAIAVAIFVVTVGLGSAGAETFGNSSSRTWGPAAPVGSGGQLQNTSKIVGYNGTFKLTSAPTFVGSCPDGYANQCASGDCTCTEFTGSGQGSFGTSSDVLLELTIDLQNGLDRRCFPAFGSLTFDASLKGNLDLEIVDLVGAACSNLDHTTTFAGGFEFDATAGVLLDAQGPSALGKFVGTNGFQLKLVGKACKGSGQCP